MSSKLKKIVRVEAPKQEKEKSSKSPKPAKSGLREFLSSRVLTGLIQPVSIIKAPKKEKSFRAQSNNSKKVIPPHVPSASRPKTSAIPRGLLTQKVSRDTSSKSRGGTFEQARLLKPKKISDLVKSPDKEKKKSQTNSQFLQSAKNNEAEKCLQFLSTNDSLNKGAEINFQDANGYTALHYACLNENLKLVNLLLYNDADVRIRQNSGQTPLCSAVIKGNLPIIKVKFCSTGARESWSGPQEQGLEWKHSTAPCCARQVQIVHGLLDRNRSRLG